MIPDLFDNGILRAISGDSKFIVAGSIREERSEDMPQLRRIEGYLVAWSALLPFQPGDFAYLNVPGRFAGKVHIRQRDYARGELLFTAHGAPDLWVWRGVVWRGPEAEAVQPDHFVNHAAQQAKL